MSKKWKKNTIAGLAVGSLLLFNSNKNNDKIETKDPKNLLNNSQPAETYIISPKDNQDVESPVHIQFGLKNFGVAPLAACVNLKNTGHFHLFINLPKQEFNANQVIPVNVENIRHFGNGYTETYLKLPKGINTLQLVLANSYHLVHNPPLYSKQITINVV
jgi:hypothetical protein